MQSKLADLRDIGETSGVFEALALSGAAFILAAGRSWSIADTFTAISSPEI